MIRLRWRAWRATYRTLSTPLRWSTTSSPPTGPPAVSAFLLSVRLRCCSGCGLLASLRPALRGFVLDSRSSQLVAAVPLALSVPCPSQCSHRPAVWLACVEQAALSSQSTVSISAPRLSTRRFVSRCSLKCVCGFCCCSSTHSGLVDSLIACFMTADFVRVSCHVAFAGQHAGGQDPGPPLRGHLPPRRPHHLHHAFRPVSPRSRSHWRFSSRLCHALASILRCRAPVLLSSRLRLACAFWTAPCPSPRLQSLRPSRLTPYGCLCCALPTRRGLQQDVALTIGGQVPLAGVNYFDYDSESLLA